MTVPGGQEWLPSLLAGPPLEVLSFSPVGEVAIAPYLSVTFDQPMIPVASRADLAPDEVPVTLTPEIPGRWRWLGTDTLLFEAGDDHARHLPMATLFCAVVPAGTTSASGAILRESVQWTFRTPAPTLRKHPLYRRRSYGVRPVLFAAFDQRIDPGAVLGHARLFVEGLGLAHALRLATAAEVAADEKVQRLADATPPGHWLAVIPCESLSPVSTYTLSFVPGTPSVEGPLVATRSQGFRFGVRSPLRLLSRGNDGTPADDWTIAFTNHLDAAAFDPALVTIEPELEQAKFTLFRHTDYAGSWTGLRISGNRQPRTGYRVTIRAGLTDTLGQKLPEDVAVNFFVQGRDPRLAAAWGEITVLDPAREPAVTIETVNLDAVRVWAFRVEPDQFPAYLRWRSTLAAGPPNDPPDDPPGAPVWDDILRTAAEDDSPTEVTIHLGGVLEGAPGHLILEVRAADEHLGHLQLTTWIQATQLGIDSFSDRDRMLVWVSRLADGAARSGVSVDLRHHDLRAASDATGVARLPAPAAGKPGLVVASDGADTALLPVESLHPPCDEGSDIVESSWTPAGPPQRTPPGENGSEVVIYALSDRYRYRPGETVFVKGWVRRRVCGPAGDLGLPPHVRSRRIRYWLEHRSDSPAIAGGTAARRWRRRVPPRPPASAEGTVRLGRLGGFHFQLELPVDLEPGRAAIVLRPAGTLEAARVRHAYPIVVQEHAGRHRIEIDTPPNTEPPRSWSETVLAVAAVGDPPAEPPAAAAPRQVRLVADRDRYLPGQRAAIAVEAPFAPAEGMMTLCRDGMVSSERFTMDAPTHVLQVPIEDRFAPNLHLRVDLLGSAPSTAAAGRERAAPPRPVHTSAMLNLPVAPLGRTLQVTAKPREEAPRPGAAMAIELTVRDAEGTPVADAELAVLAVAAEETAPGGDWLQDPVAAFYRERGAGVLTGHSREYLWPEPAASAPRGAARADVDIAPEAPAAAADTPGNRAPLALFAPEVRTDAEGRAAAALTAPAGAGRYRVIAVAAAGERLFGAGEASFTVRPPLTVRAAAPPFLTPGDRAELTAALRNRTAAAMTVRLAAGAVNAELTTASGAPAADCAVTVPAGGQVEVRFLVAPAGAGEARVRFAAAADGCAAAETTVAIPLRRTATDVLVLHGSVAAGDAARHRLHLTSDANAGGLEVSLANTAFHMLIDAFVHLWHCFHSGSEPIASRVLAVAALGDALAPFAGLPAPQAIAATMRQDLLALGRLPHRYRGSPVSPDDQKPEPFYRVHAAHALARAAARGHAVPERALAGARAYLPTVEDHATAHGYHHRAGRALEAYALYVRTLLGAPDPAAAAGLLEAGIEQLTDEAVGWLLFVLAGDSGAAGTVQDLLRLLGDRMDASTSAAAIDSHYERMLLHAESRTDAVLLEALIAAEAPRDLIAERAQRLLKQRVAGRWAAPQENVWALLALGRYFVTGDAPLAAVNAQVWIGDRAAGSGALRGGAPGHARIKVPLTELHAERTADDGVVPVTIRAAGEGTLHYRLGLRGAPAYPDTGPVEEGIAVVRNYEPADAAADVRRSRDGGWQVRAGSRVRVRLTLTVPARRVHVVLIDPLPAGLEPLGPVPFHRGECAAQWWEPPWFEYQSLCEERAEATASLLPAGIYEYRYLTRATVAGAYVAPPATAEQRYAPTTFGRSAADRLVVRGDGWMGERRTHESR